MNSRLFQRALKNKDRICSWTDYLSELNNTYDCFPEHGGWCGHGTWKTPCCKVEICECCNIITKNNNDPCQICEYRKPENWCCICETKLSQLKMKEHEIVKCLICKLPICSICKTYNSNKCFKC